MLKRLLFPETLSLIEALGEQNVRFVGGCVRDLLANIPINDIDFATVLTPEEVILACKTKNIHVVPTGIAHGTVTVVMRGHEFQVTTLRKDVSTDGRHAEVAFVDDWEADAMRRDLTINALYLSSDGTLTDFFGGLDHLRSGKITFIGNAEERIREDYLRILRYFRFFGKFGQGEPDSEIMRICTRNALKINNLSGERIQAEMFKILQLKNAAQTLELMQNAGITPFIFPGDVETSVLQNLQELEDKPNVIRRLAAIGGYELGALVQHWNMSKENGSVLKLLREEIDTSDPKVIMRRVGKERFRDIAYLEAARGRLGADLKDVLDFADSWQIPRFPIYGNDVINMGVKEGKKIGMVLAELERYWERNGYFLTRDELMKRMKHIVEEVNAR